MVKLTVWRTIKKESATAYHRRKVQAMRPDHFIKRVAFAKWALQEYTVNENSIWGRLINTDFSAMVKKNGNLNTKNHVVWSRSKEEAGDLLEFKQEKFDDSFMVWGGISFKGLVLLEIEWI